MKVTATRPVFVDSKAEGKEIRLNSGDSTDVDGRTYGDSHPFIAEGYLVAEKAPDKPKRKAKVEPEPEAPAGEEDPA